MLRLSCWAALAAAIVLVAEMPVAQAQPRILAGTLTCRMGPSIGALIASRRQVTCRFFKRRHHVERYSGAITRFGLDVGVTAGGVMRWRVVTRTTSLGRGALAGNYVGASADASFGLGVGANALVGGSRRSVALQPISVTGKVGANLAFGVAALTLRFAGSPSS